MKLFFFDTETTGTNPGVDHIIQFGGIFGELDEKTLEFKEEKQINQLININEKIPEGASAVHGIRNEDLKGYGFIDDYIYEFLSLVKKADYVIGHNIEFDKNMLRGEAETLKIPFDFDKIKWIDTMKPTTELVNGKGGKRPKLKDLHKFLFGYEFENAHDAMADIEATKNCFIELIKIYGFYSEIFGDKKPFIVNRKDIKDLENITDEQARAFAENSFEGSGSELYLNHLKSITDEQAKIFSGGDFSSIHLDGLTEITDEQAEAFLKFKGYDGIYLDGLKNISDNQLHFLATHQRVHLNGLTEITDKQIEIIINSNCDELCLNGIKELSDKSAELLGKFKGGVIELNGLEKLSDKGVENLSKFKGVTLELRSLSVTSNKQIENLISFDGGEIRFKINNTEVGKYIEFSYDAFDDICYTFIGGLKDISKEHLETIINSKCENYEILSIWGEYLTEDQAKIISNYKGRGIKFEIKKITLKEIENLVNFKGKLILLRNLEGITDKQAEAFLKFKGEDLYFGYSCLTDKQKELLLNYNPHRHYQEDYDENYNEELDEDENLGDTREVTYFHNNKNQISSEKIYFNGKKDYELTEYFENGNIEGFRKVVDGVWVKRITYYDNGNIKYSMELIDGVRIIKEYDEEGHLLKDYKKLDKNEGYGFEGEYIEYYSNGNVLEKGSYKNGYHVGEWTKYFKNGKKEEVINYEDGIQQGEYKKYYENGKIKERGTYLDGKIHGETIYYYENGNVQKRQKYKNGKEDNILKRVIIAIVGIVLGFIIPKKNAWTFAYIISGAIGIYLFYDEYSNTKKTSFGDIISYVFGCLFGARIGGAIVVFVSGLVANGLYNIGLMAPESYANIMCHKVAGGLGECNIKGNVSFDTGEKIYHKKGCENYNDTVINEAYGEMYFPSEEVAIKAGFRECKDRILYDPKDYIDY